ncbi:MAG: hypothetical protein J6Y92_09900 [Lentisphaeria bacterium]|nr:hypothetical protein [Lentisphaeria bacterium]
MKVKIPLYIVSFILAAIGFPTVLVLIYLNLIDSGISSKFFWVLSVTCCVLSVLFFALGHILAAWEEEDKNLNE